MSKNTRLGRGKDAIELDFVEREATPEFAMEIGIQIHLAGLSVLNTVSVLERLGVERVRSTVHNWVHKADLQPSDERIPNQIAVDETIL